MPAVLPDRYTAPTARVVFGRDTALYSALAVLAEGLNLTLVADNVLAETLLGELFAGPAPLPVCIEALLKSARVAPGQFRVEATEEYMLLLSAPNRSLAEPILGADEHTPGERRLLDRVVDVRLPRAQGGPSDDVYESGAAPFGAVLGELSADLGLTVLADEGVREFPVTYTVMNEVRVRTALRLLIRQWPAPNIGATIEGDIVRIGRVSR